MNSMQSFTSSIDQVLTNEYISTGIVLFLVVYSALIAPKMSHDLSKQFKNPLVNIVIALLLCYIYTKNKSVALMAALSFMLSLQYSKKSDASEVIAQKIVNLEKPQEEVKVLVEEEMKRVISEEMKKPAEERKSLEEVRHIAEERVENVIMEETRKSEKIYPSEEGTNHSLVTDIVEKESENKEVKSLVSEEIKRIISEESKKPAEERRPSEEVMQLAEERVENKLIEENRRASEEIINNVTPMSRILVEEEIKKNPKANIPQTQIPVPVDNDSLAPISDNSKSLLQEQINNTRDIDTSSVKSRSTRGLEVNKKCNLCNIKPTNNNIEINGFGGNTLAEF